MSDGRPPWDFGYAPVRPAAGPPEETADLVVATPAAVDPGRIEEAAGEGARGSTLLCDEPLFWTHLALAQPDLPATIAGRLRSQGISVRYVTSAERPSLAAAPPLDVRGVSAFRPRAWAARPKKAAPVGDSPGCWFLRREEGGIDVDRDRFGAGGGTRLAVVDDDALEAETLELDAEVLIGVDRPPRHGPHGALMVGWAVGARGHPGVAPAASPRLYVIPKPGRGVTALPLAIARAARDGADVILSATYVEGCASPLLDDALEVASRLGRRGRGAAVVMPTGREASSAEGSLHASLSLGLGEPASDPRVFCVAPGARGGGWFLWRDRRGRLRPFANRGPAVRWTAPGDDLAYPFTAPGDTERLFHAESSGAAAVAAGVLLLVLAQNPTLRLPELGAVIDATLAPAAPATAEPLADPADALPEGRDRDGHDAKQGYGRIQAGRACLAAADPVSAALTAMGEDDAARAFLDVRLRSARVRAAYSPALGRWAVRALLADPEAAGALRVILRHLRLLARHGERISLHGEGALTRRVVLLLRRLARARVPATASVRDELGRLEGRVATISEGHGGALALERTMVAVAARCLAPPRAARPS
jgi:hypothetical protein